MRETEKNSDFEIDKIKTLLCDKEVFVFDWDGTILDSMSMKAENFGTAFCSVSRGGGDQELSQSVAKHYLRLSGYPRKHIFLRIENIFKDKIKTDTFESFNSAFESLNKASLIHANIFSDALSLLEELINRDNRIFISSSVPPLELAELVEATLPAHIRNEIDDILGSSETHAKGSGHLNSIMCQTNLPEFKLIVFGDDPADHELSSESGVDCILVDRSGISEWKGGMMVNSLNQIKERLPI